MYSVRPRMSKSWSSEATDNKKILGAAGHTM